jgi:hypothetical protein
LGADPASDPLSDSQGAREKEPAKTALRGKNGVAVHTKPVRVAGQPPRRMAAHNYITLHPLAFGGS